MFKITKYLALLLSVLVITNNSRAIKAQNEVTLKIENKEQIDLCGEDRNKRVIITLYMGKILPTDSLFGFNGELNYNPDKILFHTSLPLNTLAEFFEYNRADFSTKGKINFTVSQWMSNIPIAGDRPLYAFLGNYLGKCPDTSWVNLDYIEFTDEFKKTIKDVSNGLVKAEILYDESRYLKTFFNIDTLEFQKEDTLKNLQVILDVKPGLRISKLQLLIENENPSQFDIMEISSLNEFIIIDSINENSNKIVLFLNVLNDTLAGVNLNFSLLETFKSDTINKISITPIKINDCTCISELKGSFCYLKSNKIDTIPTTINNNDNSIGEQNLLNIHNNYISINNEKRTIQQVIITDLLGREVFKHKPYNENYIIINTDLLTNGLYIIHILKINNQREIKKLIKN